MQAKSLIRHKLIGGKTVKIIRDKALCTVIKRLTRMCAQTF